jgi:FHA domain
MAAVCSCDCSKISGWFTNTLQFGRLRDEVGLSGTRWSPDGSGRSRTSYRWGCGILDSLQASAKELFIADLNRLRDEAGQPSLAELVQRADGKFSKSTIDDHLSTRRVLIPNWRLTSAYVLSCHAAAEATGLNVERLGTIEEWRIRWAAAKNNDRDAVSPIRDSRNVSTYTMLDNDLPSIYEVPEPSLHYRLESRNSQSAPTHHGDTTANITAVMRQLDEDLSELSESLSIDNGLLVVTNGPTIGTRFAIDYGLVTIGRDQESDVLLDNPTVSRRHAVIHRYRNEFKVRDVGSRNDTFLNQKKITEESPLVSNDELQVGVFRMLFVQGAGNRTKRGQFS